MFQVEIPMFLHVFSAQWIEERERETFEMEGDLEESIPGPSRGVRSDQPFQSDVDLIPHSVPNLNPLQLRKKKISAIRQLLYRDPKALDIKWSLFITALQSYKYDSLLKPFPPEFIINGTKDINYLVSFKL